MFKLNGLENSWAGDLRLSIKPEEENICTGKGRIDAPANEIEGEKTFHEIISIFGKTGSQTLKGALGQTKGNIDIMHN